MEVNCNECGGSDWSKVLETDYPERRQERNRTVKKVYFCENCDSQGKQFVHHNGGPDIFSGAMR